MANEPVTYSFIDVQNTEGTADFLGFIIDWEKLISHLDNRYSSKGNYLYLGIEQGDEVRTEEFESLRNKTCFVKPKIFKKYKQPDKIYNVTCANCKNEFVKRVNGKSDWKCNCDVDLTIDVIEISQTNTIRALIFTGDGDFTPLVEKVINGNSNSKVYIFSSPTVIHGRSRLSTKLRGLTNLYRDRVIFVNLEVLKKIIEKDITIN